jgi:phospholipid-binding lipoprotein MlaA
MMKTTKKPVLTLLLVGLTALLLGGCSTAPVQKGEAEPAFFDPERLLLADPDSAIKSVNDPWQGFNRTMYRFNYHFDRYVFLPVVRGYQTVTPDFVEQGIHNFFNNIRDVTTFINSVLQLSPRKSAETASRIVWNSTLGVFGFFDVASNLMQIPRHQEDLGQTLGYWGVGSGPYLVLPIYGPTSVRDAFGQGVDWFVRAEIQDSVTDLETWQQWTLTGLNAVDTRAKIPFRYFENGTTFEYNWVRLLSTTQREMQIAK